VTEKELLLAITSAIEETERPRHIKSMLFWLAHAAHAKENFEPAERYIAQAEAVITGKCECAQCKVNRSAIGPCQCAECRAKPPTLTLVKS
jgi:hypothetical protein